MSLSSSFDPQSPEARQLLERGSAELISRRRIWARG
jgi:hypothetical protein